MKIFFNLLFLLISISSSNKSFAYLSKELIIRDNYLVSYSQVNLGKVGKFFVASRNSDGDASIRLYKIGSIKENQTDIKMSFLPIFFANGEDTNLLISANYQGEWFATLINSAKKITKEIKLSDFSFVTKNILVNNIYFISGMDKNGVPKITSLDENLKIINNALFQKKGYGEIVIISASKNKIIAIENYQTGKSSILWLSNQLSEEKEIPIDGGATSAIVLKNGLGISYSNKENIIFEMLDENGTSKWKTITQQRKGENSLKFPIIETNGDIAIIGKNNSKLFITKIKNNGKIKNTEIYNYRLPPSTESWYVIDIEENKIKIIGIFIETEENSNSYLLEISGNF